jgi:hypothetical protein
LNDQRGVARQRRPLEKVKEYNEQRSLERLTDMAVSRKKISFWDFWGSLAVARRGFLRDEHSKGMITCQ